MNHSETAQAVLSEFGPPMAFEPFAYYDPDGDCVEFHLANEPYHAKRLDGWVSVYYSEATDEVVGGLVKGIKRNLLKRFPGLQIEIQGDEIEISLLLRAPAWTSAKDEPTRLTYQAMIRKVRELDAQGTGLRAELQA